MRIRLVRRPGQHGTKAYVEQYGDRLVCVRYRYDAAAGRRYKTVEIIVDEAPWQPRENHRQEARPAYRAGTLVGVRVRYAEKEMQQQLRGVGATWLPQLHLWVLTYRQAIALGLADRIAGAVTDLAARR